MQFHFLDHFKKQKNFGGEMMEAHFELITTRKEDETKTKF